MSLSMQYSGSADTFGQCVGGHPLLQSAAEILMNSNLDARGAFHAAGVQMTMAHQLSGGQTVAEAGAAIGAAGKSGSVSR